jgi:PIN domain-containing protein
LATAIEKAKQEKKIVSFVTADEKEDWWRIFEGKTIGPRPELIAEFRQKADVEFQMFSPDRFMTAAAEKLPQDVKATAIEEVKEVRKAAVSRKDFARLWPAIEEFVKRQRMQEAQRPPEEVMDEHLEREQRTRWWPHILPPEEWGGPLNLTPDVLEQIEQILKGQK